MSRLALCLSTALCAAIATTSAQPQIRDPTTTPGIGRQLTTNAAPLSADEVRRLCQRLQDSLTRQAAAAPGSNTLRSAGLPAETDAVEQAEAARQTGTVGPIGIGLLESPARAPNLAVDPALAEVARLRLHSRLDRNPTAAELATELQAFDARIVQANRWLASNRTRIAKAYAAAGALPPDFDDAAVDPPPARRTDSPAVQAGFRDLFRALLTQPGSDVTVIPSSPSTPRLPTTTIPTSPGTVTAPARAQTATLTAVTCAGR